MLFPHLRFVGRRVRHQFTFIKIVDVALALNIHATSHPIEKKKKRRLVLTANYCKHRKAN